jgi:hypothetical protein
MMKTLKKSIRKLQNSVLSDKAAIKYKFRKYLGYSLDLNHPKTFNEKLQWLKIYDHSEALTITADKFLSRNYIAETIGDQYLIPLELDTMDTDELIPENLPDHPFIIKANHDCGGTLIIRNKDQVDWDSAKNFFRNRLRKNYYYYGRERQYKNIRPRIIVEKLLLDKKGDVPYDYKVYCFNGKAKILAVDKDRGKSTKARNWYDLDWNKKDIFWNTKGDNSIIEKPASFDKMIELSEKIAEKFLFLRVDWYLLNDQLFIGELTLHPGSGFVPFLPEKWDKILGDFLTLPL